MKRLFFGSGGPAQWRLNGPDSASNAKELVQKVPVTNMMKIFALVCIILIMLSIITIFKNPLTFTLIGVSYLFYKKIFTKQN